MDRQWRSDGALTAAVLLIGFGWALLGPPEQRALDPLGALLMVAAILPLAVARIAAMPVLVAHTVIAAAYHASDYPHKALIPATMVALFAAARYGNRRRTVLVVLVIAPLVVGGIAIFSQSWENVWLQGFGAIGWILVACVAGEATHLQEAYLAAVVDRAERAERFRDEEASRQVTEERLRIARDMHDLLAHTITVIQIQSGVAAHLLTEGKAEPATVLGALDTIADACVDARAELAATVDVLRSRVAEPQAPPPSLARIPALTEPVEAAGIAVTLDSTGQVRALAPTVEMVGYRIVQEALTNVVKHSGATEVRVELDYLTDRLIVRVADNGRGTGGATTGFGITGMIERAAAIGGRVRTGGADTGFTVTAELPVTGRPLAAVRRNAEFAGAGS
ncbi:sensor histidine kinase [Nocardia sp. NPDC049149]|uniref:sensor histidine kinase n=1 Tax=Nocardia sp. NPDC049149 TaxID=3364315 RepID=UPI0037177453